MMRRISFLTVVLLVVCFPAFAGQGPLNRYKPWPQRSPFAITPDRLNSLIRDGIIPLSIGDLIELTLENNLDIKVDRLAPLASDYFVRTNYRPFEPVLRLSATVARDTSGSQTQLTGVQSVSQLTHQYRIGFGQSFKTGSDIAIDFFMNRTSSNNAFNTFNPSWIGQMRYAFTQRVLNGFGESVNSHSIRVAQNNKTISDLDFERSVIDLVSQAEKSYWDLVFAGEDLKVKQASLELAEKTLSDNQRQVDVGTLARIDLVQSRSQVASRKEELIVSTFTQVQVQDQVKKVVSRQPDPGLVLAMITPTQMAQRPDPADTLPVNDAIRVALENRPELRQANLRLRNSELDVQYARNQLLPTLDVTFTFAQNGLGGKQTNRSGLGANAPILSVIPGGFGNALGEIFDSRSPGVSLGFNMEIPLTNRSQQAEYSRVVVEKNTADENIKSIEQQIALEVRNALNAVDMNKARIEAATASRELAEEQLLAEQRKFELGASTVRFVLEEQRNLSEMQTGEISAIVGYRKALVDYDHALGVTLKKNNITIEKAVAAMK